MEKTVALKAKKKKEGVCPSPWIMPFLFVVKIEIIKCIGQYSDNFRQRVPEKKEKKNWLKAGKKKYLEILWYLVWVLVQVSALCFILIYIEGFVVRPRSSPTRWLQEVVSCGSECLGTSWGICMTQK